LRVESVACSVTSPRLPPIYRATTRNVVGVNKVNACYESIAATWLLQHSTHHCFCFVQLLCALFRRRCFVQSVDDVATTRVFHAAPIALYAAAAVQLAMWSHGRRSASKSVGLGKERLRGCKFIW